MWQILWVVKSESFIINVIKTCNNKIEEIMKIVPYKMFSLKYFYILVIKLNNTK